MKNETNKDLSARYFESATHYLRSELFMSRDISLGNGMMGIVITYLYYERAHNEEQYQKLIASMFQRIHQRVGQMVISTNLYFGVLGTVLGICHLIREGFIAGSENNIVRQFDSRIYQIVTTDYSQKKEEFIHTTSKLNMLLYLLIRLEKMEKSERAIFEDVCIKLINDAYADVLKTNEEEFLFYEHLFKNQMSYFLFLLGKAYSLGFYKDRILHILEEYGYMVFSKKPLLHANRLVLLVAAHEVYRATRHPKWGGFVKELHHNISFDEIYQREILQDKIFFRDGIAGIYLMLLHYNKHSEEKFEMDSNYFYQRIVNCKQWKEVNKDSKLFKEAIGLDGFGGLIILLEYLQKQIKHHEG